MPIVFGVNPGGKSNFALATLFWSGQLPASLIATRSLSGVDEALYDIIGVVGEWGELSAVAIDAPLSWGGSPSGWRRSDRLLQKRLPEWAPRTWHRAPNSLPGSVSVQGPALTWGLASEIKAGQLPHHTVLETNARVALALVAPDQKEHLLAAYSSRTEAAERKRHVQEVVGHFVDAGLLRIEAEEPCTAEELDAFACAMTALAVAVPETGLVTHELAGGDIRPVGKRPLVILEALP